MARIRTLEMRDIVKDFSGLRANDGVSLKIEAGEILGLLGENGAGKTTLMNILFGLYRPDGGTILINGEEVVFRSPRDAMQRGIGMIHQHFMLVQKHTVLENVALGFEKAPFFFPLRQVRRRLAEFSYRFGLAVRPDEPVWKLSAGEQQRVEILKALIRSSDLLIMDEPTSVLTPRETAELFDILKRMSGEGHSIILISHKLDEITRICSRVQVLRKGKVAGEAPMGEVSAEDLARMMVGRRVADSYPKADLPPGRVVLEILDLEAQNDQGAPAVRGVSFEVRENEIFGIAGVSGNGQQELVECVTGLRRASAGAVRLLGREITGLSPRQIHNRGISHVPEERIKFGIVPNLLLYENAVLKRHHRQPYSIRNIMNYPAIRRHAGDLVKSFQVATPSIYSPMKHLSGGNIQKLILGREISADPVLMIAAHPTYGLDVGASEYIRGQIIARRDRGGAVLLVSEDLEELFMICDRVAVMFEGRIMGIVDPRSGSFEEVGMMMAGAVEAAGGEATDAV